MNFDLEQDIIRMGSHEVANYLRDLVWEQRENRKIPVVVKGFPLQIFFVDCNEKGYPKYRRIKFLELLSLTPRMYNDGEIPLDMEDITVFEKEVSIDNPALQSRYAPYMREEIYYHMWEGRITSNRRVPVEELNVSELMRLSQKVIKERNSVILSDAEKNALIK